MVIRTIVEFFDECQIENVAASLRFHPEKIIFVGFKEVMTKRRMKAVEDFFEACGENVALEFEVVGRYDYQGIADKLSDIIENNDDCCFDITGGRELILLAMGDVATKHKIPLLQFNIRTGNVIKIKNCENIPETEKTALSIKQSVILNGGIIISDNAGDAAWELTPSFKKDVKAIWDICKDSCAEWNYNSGVLARLEKNVADDLFVKFKLDEMKPEVTAEIFENLHRKGLIIDYINKDGIISFRYKNEQVHRCLTKAGNILELYTYMAAVDIADETPGFYDDIDIGVMVDWDGVTYPSHIKETRNEIDVMLMRDMVPVFISCKNGEVHKEALYELNTVAEKFGGEYAKKILVSTYVSSSESNRKYLVQRAKDMKIELIKDIHTLSYKEFVDEIKEKVK